MPLLNGANDIFLGTVPVLAMFLGTELVWPPAQGSQPVISNISTLGTLTASWAAVENASSYQLRRNGTLIASPTTTSYNDSGLAWNTSYTYTITPIVFGVAGAESIPSAAVYITKPVGPKPSISSITAGGTLVLSWAAVVNAASYKVYRNGSLLVTTTSRTYTDTGLAWGSTYSYGVVPVVGGKDGTMSPTTSSGVMPSGTVGALVASSKTYTNVTVSWPSVVGATQYYVYIDGAHSATLTGLSYAVATTENTTKTIYVRPLRNGVFGGSSATYSYYSGRAEQRDVGSKTGMVFDPAKVDSWRPVDGWDWLTDIAAQGYFNSAYGNYKGIIYYGSAGVRSALRTTLGGDGTSRQLNGTCTKAELYLYKKTGVGIYGPVETEIRLSNSDATGGEPSGINVIVRTTAASGAGSWLDIETSRGQALGDGVNKSLFIKNDGSANYAQFTDCRLRLSWAWNYVTVTALPNTWTV